ncbi:hypothetical protein BH11MYX1_BH11MYX1_57030 [soil metagenome]
MTSLVIAAVIAGAFALRSANAELEDHVFTSRADRIRVVVPRGWRESDAPTYPGLLLWMMRPEATIVLTGEELTRALYCSWPVACRTSRELGTLQGKVACALRQKLTNERMRVGPVQGGPKENEDAGVPSVWFDYDDGKHFMRQAVALGEDRVFSLVLSASSAEGRNGQIRAFEQALRTLRPLTADELGAPPAPGTTIVQDGGVAAIGDAGAVAPLTNDGGLGPAATVPSRTPSQPDVVSVDAPAAKINPIGACAK